MKDELLKCPCCKENRHAVKETPLLAVEADSKQRNATPWWAKGEGWSIEKAKSQELQWACDACLESGRAVAAQTWLQTFCDYSPHFAYFDEFIRCEDCQITFAFSAKEQQYWYETLKFWVQSRPQQCVACRRARRAQGKAERERQRKLRENE